jgi:hypothetical protein
MEIENGDYKEDEQRITRNLRDIYEAVKGLITEPSLTVFSIITVQQALSTSVLCEIHLLPVFQTKLETYTRKNGFMGQLPSPAPTSAFRMGVLENAKEIMITLS